MKRKRRFFLLLFAIAFLFTGCFETTEELTIAENGSGTYKVYMDFKALFEMFDMIKTMDSTGKADMGFPKERKDTTINLHSFTDTATSLTAEQKALYQKATVNVLMDGTAKEFKMAISMPFEKTADVEKLAKLLSSNEGSGIMSKLFKQSKAVSNEAGDDETGQLPDLNTYFDLLVEKGSIERKLNKARYDSLMQHKGELSTEMLSSITMNTIIHLPHAAKKITGSKVSLSTDKKTITLKATMSDFFKDPHVFSYRVEY